MPHIVIYESECAPSDHRSIPLYAINNVPIIGPFEQFSVQCQVEVTDIEPQTVGLVLGDNNVLADTGLFVDMQVITAPSQGPLVLVVNNCINSTESLKKGDLLAQLVFVPSAPNVIVTYEKQLPMFELEENTDASTKQVSFNLSDELCEI